MLMTLTKLHDRLYKAELRDGRTYWLDYYGGAWNIVEVDRDRGCGVALYEGKTFDQCEARLAEWDEAAHVPPTAASGFLEAMQGILTAGRKDAGMSERPRTDLSIKMHALADEGHSKAAELRSAADAFDEASAGFYSEPQTCDVRKFMGSWARVRRILCDASGEALI
jgi:hypothetical protein